CLDLVTPDGQAVVARALVAGAETCEAVPAGHDEAGATHAALRQSGEEVLGPSRDADVAHACDREAGRLLTVLRGVPEIVAHNPEGRNLPRDPFRPRIQARDAPARVRSLHVSQPVPAHAADVQPVVQDAGAPFRVPGDR